jgi:hypothetical protein
MPLTLARPSEAHASQSLRRARAEPPSPIHVRCHLWESCRQGSRGRCPAQGPRRDGPYHARNQRRNLSLPATSSPSGTLATLGHPRESSRWVVHMTPWQGCTCYRRAPLPPRCRRTTSSTRRRRAIQARSSRHPTRGATARQQCRAPVRRYRGLSAARRHESIQSIRLIVLAALPITQQTDDRGSSCYVVVFCQPAQSPALGPRPARRREPIDPSSTPSMPPG